MDEDRTRLPMRDEGQSFYAAVVTFPVACFILTLLSDLAYWATDSFVWETVSAWLLMVGLIVGGAAVVAGGLDLVRSRRIRGLGQPWPAVLGHAVAFALALVNMLVHSRDGYTAVVPQGLILSALAVLALFVAMLFGRSFSLRKRRRGLA